MCRTDLICIWEGRTLLKVLVYMGVLQTIINEIQVFFSLAFQMKHLVIYERVSGMAKRYRRPIFPTTNLEAEHVCSQKCFRKVRSWEGFLKFDEFELLPSEVTLMKIFWSVMKLLSCQSFLGICWHRRQYTNYIVWWQAQTDAKTGNNLQLT